ADGHGLAERCGARIEMRDGILGIPLRQAPQYNTHIVERHAAGDRSLRSSPRERALEEPGRFLELFGGLAEVRDRAREIVQDSSVPAAFVRRVEALESLRKAAPRASEVCGLPRGSEEHGDVVEESAAVLGRLESQLRNHLPEIVRQKSGSLCFTSL